jgi:hypothetical protein
LASIGATGGLTGSLIVSSSPFRSGHALICHGAGLDEEAGHLVGAGSSDLHAHALQQSLSNWSMQLCQRLAADLGEKAVESAAGP